MIAHERDCMLIDPGNSACESLCRVGISLLPHKHHPFFRSVSYSHQTFPLMRHWHPLQPVTCLPCHLLTPSSKPPVCQPPWIIHLICPFWQSQPLCRSSKHYRQEKFVYLSLGVSLLHFLLLSSPLPQLFFFLIVSHKCHIPLPFIGICCHSDLLKWMWQAASLVHASYKSHTFASIEFHLIPPCFFCMLCLTMRECFFVMFIPLFCHW